MAVVNAVLKQVKQPILSVEPVVFLHMLSISIEQVVFQDVVSTKYCFSFLNTTDLNVCRNMSGPDREYVKSQTSTFLMYFNAIRNMLPFIFSFWIGNWNTMLGWKWPMLLPSLFNIPSCICYVLSTVNFDLPVEFLLFSAVFIGLSTDTLGLFCSTNGYISDVYEGSSKSSRMSVLMAAVFISTSIGSFASAWLVVSLKFSTVFILIAFLYGINVFYVLVFIRNVKSDSNQKVRKCLDLVNCNNVSKTLKVLTARRANRCRRNILLIYFGAIMQFLGLQCFIVLPYVYTTDEPISMEADEYGLYGGIKAAVQGFCLLILAPLGYKYLQLHDTTVGAVGSLSRMLGSLVLGISTNKMMVYTSALFYAFSEVDLAAGRSLLTQIVQPQEKGSSLALFGTVQTFGKFAGSLMFTGLYPLTSFFKGFLFEMAALLQLTSIVIFLYLRKEMSIFRAGYESIDSKVQEKSENIGSVEQQSLTQTLNGKRHSTDDL